jgi:DNA-binding HxlR family transcriptional regulator
MVGDKRRCADADTRRGLMRNGELMRALDALSQKMLTQTLREMERNGIVLRRDHGRCRSGSNTS